MEAFVDAVGVAHPAAGADARIVSLVPSITELLFDLDLDRQLVGRTRFCVHPAARVAAVGRVGGTKDVDMDRLRAQAPTHVIVNVDENTREAAAEIGTFVPHVVVTHPLGPDDNPALYRLLGGLFGRRAQAESLCAAYARAADRVTRLRASLPPREVLYLIWRRPWMTVAADTYIARMLATVNWSILPTGGAARYPEVGDLREAAARAQIILFPSEPFPFGPAHIEEFRAEAGCTSQRLLPIDGEAVSWYGSRAIAGLDYLAGLAGDLAAAA